MQEIKKLSRGFTLIEMAISIAILGLIISAAILPYSLYLKRRAFETTQDNISLITTQIGDFRILNGYYPCAAPLNATRNNATYGHASPDCVAQAIAPNNCKNGMVAGGICIQTQPAGALRVALGTIPFRELGIDESEMFDGYGNRIFYAVTENEATLGFTPNGGGIEVRNDANASALAIPNSAHFVVFSAGPDGAGAFSHDGVLTAPCPAAAVKESANCSLGAAASYRSAQASTVAGANYFDDTISYFTRADVPLWEYSANNTDIHTIPGGNVGAFLSSQDAVNYKTQIKGTALIDQNLMSQDLCNSANGDCFNTSLLTGNDGVTNVTCPAGAYLQSIHNNTWTCGEVYAQCDPGKVMQGIQADGTAICASYQAPPADCLALSDTLCAANDVQLPASISGTYLLPHAGTSKIRIYKCNNGSWYRLGDYGSCTCTPSVDVTTAACDTGFSGVKTTTTTTVCPAGNVTVTTDASACKCVGDTRTNNANCPPPLTGSYTQTSTLVCPAGTYTPYTPANPPAGACTCTPITQSVTNTCGGNLTGTWTQTRDLTCPDGTFTAWAPPVPPNGACTCDSTKVLNGVDPCPASLPVGPGVKWHENLQCPDATWGKKVYEQNVTDVCEEAPPIICHWANTSSGRSRSNGVGPPVGSACGCGESGVCSTQLGTNSYENYTGCICQ